MMSLTSTEIALLKRFVESTGSVAGAERDTGILDKRVRKWAKTEDGADLIESWMAVFALRTWRIRPGLVSKALQVVEDGLNGFEEKHIREREVIVRDDHGVPVVDVDPETGVAKIRTRREVVETKTITKAPDVRFVTMILGGTAKVEEIGAATESPVIQISDEFEESI